MKGLLTLKTLSVDKILEILNTAIEFKKGRKADYSGKIMATLFFEDSTRTQYSFQMAMLKLGITPLTFSVNGSSLSKGESLYDTVKTFESFGVDGLVIRNTKDGYFDELQNIKVPIFNAGDGKSNHPTQTLLDLMTIYEEYGHFEGLKICIVGDISHSRVAHGNAEVMKRLGVQVYTGGPEEFADDTAPYLTIDEAVKECDVINLLRVQFERHNELMKLSKEEYHRDYGLTAERESKMKESAIIIHPAPINRGMEIASEIAESKRSRIFKQITNGVFVRMAVISMVLEGAL